MIGNCPGRNGEHLAILQARDLAAERTQKLDTLLDKKFEEARKKAKDADPDEKPHNPMDWD